jgi:hypothetical protein
MLIVLRFKTLLNFEPFAHECYTLPSRVSNYSDPINTRGDSVVNKNKFFDIEPSHILLAKPE